eukprot:scaffold272427_cov30-Tisochrysis_lutea.AAC.1
MARRLPAIEEESNAAQAEVAIVRELHAVEALCDAVDRLASVELKVTKVPGLTRLRPLLEAAHAEVTLLRSVAAELQVPHGRRSHMSEPTHISRSNCRRSSPTLFVAASGGA